MVDLLTVHAHPDDESIACGGILARYADEGLGTMVVTCTRGDAGENLAGIDLGGRDLVEVRTAELEAALGILGVHRHAYLGYRDSGMAGTETNALPGSFHLADLDEAAGRLARIVRAVRPRVLTSDDQLGTYGHPDHVKANRVAVRAVELAADPAALPDAGAPWRVPKRYHQAIARSRVLWLHRYLVGRGLASPFGGAEAKADRLPFGTPDEQITTAVDVRPWLQRKLAAMAAHRSQMAANSLFLNVPEDVAVRLFGTETFELVDGEAAASASREDDLFAGLRR